MKRFLAVAILTMLCLTGCIFAGELRQNTKEETSLCLVGSFGWDIAEDAEIAFQAISAKDFYKTYSFLNNKSVIFPEKTIEQEDIAQGNIPGIQSALFEETYNSISNEENVFPYCIPLAYDMPENASLQALIGFYQEKLCMTAVHVNLSDSVSDAPMPLTWPLNVDQNTIETWKREFEQLQIQSSQWKHDSWR